MKKIIKPGIIDGFCQHVLFCTSWSKRLKTDYREEHLGLINYELHRIWQDMNLHHHLPVSVIVSFIFCICLLTQQVHNHKDAIVF